MGHSIVFNFARRMTFQLPPFLPLKARKDFLPPASWTCCSKTGEEQLWCMSAGEGGQKEGSYRVVAVMVTADCSCLKPQAMYFYLLPPRWDNIGNNFPHFSHCRGRFFIKGQGKNGELRTVKDGSLCNQPAGWAPLRTTQLLGIKCSGTPGSAT